MVTTLLRTALPIVLTAFIGATSASCFGSDDNDAPALQTAVSATPETLSFEAEGGTAEISVTSSGEWDAASYESWLTLSKKGTVDRQGTVAVTVAPNTSRNARNASVTIMSGTSRKSVEVTQAGKAPEPVDTTVSVPEGYALAWHDEFDGNSLDLTQWRHEVQGPGWVNNELQTYVNGSYGGTRVTEVADGVLTIRCFSQGGKIYSARIYARENEGWRYGIFEARIRLPKGKGTWPAFWMMPVGNDFSANPWPRCGEIDIMEEVGYNPCYTSSSIHCESYNHVMNTQCTAERYTMGAQDEFHVYRLVWTPSGITTYVDDARLLSFSNDGAGNVSTWPFNKPFYLILNLAWGGSWGGAQGVDESCLPAEMEVDYVRVFQPVD